MTAIRNKKAYTSHLRVVKGGKSNPTKNIYDHTWIFIQSALWNNKDFSKSEVNLFTNLISEHFNRMGDPNKILEEIIERVCLAKRYVNRRKGRYISKPVDWLNINYINGLAGTQGWYADVEAQRLTVPNYNKGIRILAKAITKFLQEPTSKTIMVYRKKLISENQFDLLQVFNNTIISLQINN
jgi:hypothetical protein